MGTGYRGKAVPGLRSKDWDNRSVVEELRLAASEYWLPRVMAPGTSRSEVLKYLRVVEPRKEDLIRDLERTLAPRTSLPGSIESLIDDLTDYSTHRAWFSTHDGVYLKLSELGFDAVPALLKHLSDPRLSRCEGTRQHGGVTNLFGNQVPNVSHYPARVGHLVSWLLDDLSGGEIGGRRLEADEKMADPQKVREWWDKAQRVGEEKWLLDHLRHEDPEDGFIPYSVFLRVLAAKYPVRLAELYQRALWSQPAYDTGNLATAVAACKLPRERKLAILEEGAKHALYGHRHSALEALAGLDDAVFRKHLLATLRWLPRECEAQSEWLWPEADVVRVVRRTADRGCWDALSDMARFASTEARLEMLWSVSIGLEVKQNALTYREGVRFLASLLDDRSESEGDPWEREMNSPVGAVRDAAAQELATLLRVPQEFQFDDRVLPLGARVGAARRGRVPQDFHDRVSRFVLREVVRIAAWWELARPEK
jgi:hypothetical protein